MIITIEMLQDKKACQEQVDLFEAIFGNAVEVTLENCIEAARRGLHIDWAASNLLNRKQREFYKESEAPLWAAYEEACAPLWAAYKEACASLWATYEEAKAPLWAAYDEAKAPLWAAYKETEAISFYNASKI